MNSQRGFTLIEALMVIVITGIIGTMVAVFIKTASDSYFDAQRRAELTDAADVALRRLSREVRLALPNSLRVKDSNGNVDTCAVGTCYIEFIPTSDGGRYRDSGDGSTGGNVLDFTDTSKNTFDVLGPVPSMATGASGDYIVVYNLGPGYAPANAYDCSGACNRARVSSLSGSTVTLASNVFAAESPPLPSPGNRFQVVPNASQAVTYACKVTGADYVTRYWKYGFSAAQPTSFGGSSARLVGNTTCQASYTPNVLQRSGILYVKLTVADSSGESVSVFQQIHVDNTP
jgi:MSHA biogenesis protein MshO